MDCWDVQILVCKKTAWYLSILRKITLWKKIMKISYPSLEIGIFFFENYWEKKTLKLDVLGSLKFNFFYRFFFFNFVQNYKERKQEREKKQIVWLKLANFLMICSAFGLSVPIFSSHFVHVFGYHKRSLGRKKRT